MLTFFRYAFSKHEVPDELSLESYVYYFLYEIPMPQPGDFNLFYFYFLN